MTDFDVTIERPHRSQKPAARALLGFHPRLIAAFVAAMMVFTYALMFARYGAFQNPVEYLYPAAFVILALALLPGLLAVGAYQAMTGTTVEPDARMIVIVVAISALAYGAMAQRVLQDRKAQAPYSSAAD